MKKVVFTVFTILLLSVYTNCTPEAITNESETEILTVDPSDDGTIDNEEEEEPIQG